MWLNETEISGFIWKIQNLNQNEPSQGPIDLVIRTKKSSKKCESIYFLWEPGFPFRFILDGHCIFCEIFKLYVYPFFSDII